jgi:DNA-binding SARP family transcriptional activator/DNA-binding beta-propeller fold protein YncE
VEKRTLKLVRAPFRNLETSIQRAFITFVRFVVLGPLEVDDGGRPVALGGPKQRALLAVLLLQANEPVSRDRLIDDLWGEHPPANPGPTLDTYISRLRKLLGRERLLRRGGGYMLRVDPGELDLERFERLAAAGSYREALESWRGPALADLLKEPFAAAEAERLEERRLAVLEERIDSDLAEGAGVELVPEIERLVREQPLRERLVGQLMVALYRAGRQTAALEVYGAARRRLAEDLGLEPGPQLKDLERRILSHDPSLAPPPRMPLALGRQGHRPTRRQAALLTAACVMAIGALVGGLVLSTAAPTARALPPRPTVIARITTGHYNPANYQPGGGPLAVGEHAVWAISDAGSTLMKIDPARNRIVKRIKVETPAAIAAGDNGVWLSSQSYNRVIRINPKTDRKTLISVDPTPEGIAVSPGAVWVVNAGLLPACQASVSRIDPATNQVVKTIRIPSKGKGCAEQANLVASRNAVWVALSNKKSIVRISPANNKVVATVPVGFLACGALAADRTVLWVTATTCAGVGTGEPAGANPSAWPNGLAQINSRTNTLTQTKVAEADPAGVAAAFGSVWVTGVGNVDQINPTSGRRVARLHVGGSPDQLGAGFGSLWVNDDDGRVLRIKPQS